MPFLDKLQLWADERPHDTAVVVGSSRPSPGRDSATPQQGRWIPTATTVLAEPNSVRFVSRYTAAVAGERQCAVLDPDMADLR